MEFMGYVRPDGKVGARNYVAVIPSVTCANDVANAICHQVQGTITYLHHQGCCQMPPDLERVTDTLISLGMSPNVGAILIVSLGCEGTDHERMYKELSATGKHVEIIHIQELGGVSKAIQLGTDIARKLVIEISGLQRQPVDVSKIVMAIKCGASDTTSGMASNCVIGYVADKLVDLGATVIFGETTEFLGGEHLLARRAVNKEVADKIYEIVTNMENRAKSIGCDMRKGQPTPGNIAGGLSSIEEKSLGAIVKSGTRPIQGVLEYPQHVTDQKGLWIKLSAEECGVFQEKLFKFPGFYIQRRTIRQYNYNAAAHVLGDIAEVSKGDIEADDYYVRGDFIGKQGVERSYEKQLRGEKGVEILLRDARGRIQGRYMDGKYDKTPVPGKNLKLGIDIELQMLGERQAPHKNVRSILLFIRLFIRQLH